MALQYILFGSGLAFAAAVQPGPLQAFLLSRAAVQGWRRTLPAALSPLLSDIPVALLALVVVGRLPVAAQRGLRIAGGVLLLYLAFVALRDARRNQQPQPGSASGGPRTLFQAVAVNIVNPNPYLSWALIIGPTVAAAWREAHVNAVLLVVAFYATMVCCLAAFIVLASSARLLRPRATQILIAISAVTLAALGVYQLVLGARGSAA